MFGSRCSPVSYGIICDLLYDPAKHLGEKVRRDPRDDNLYAIDQVEWLIIQVRITFLHCAMFYTNKVGLRGTTHRDIKRLPAENETRGGGSAVESAHRDVFESTTSAPPELGG